MTDEKLNLIPNLKSRLAHGIFKIVGEKVSGFQRLTHGEINWVYKVSTEKRNLLVRIHKFRDWPDPKILTRVHYLLQRHRITTPKVLHLDNTKKYFPRGWEIMEYCEGMNASDAIGRGKVSFEAFHRRLGALLAKVHQIKLPRFGSLNDSRGFADYLEFRFQKLEKNLQKFEHANLLPQGLKREIKNKVSLLIGGLAKSFKPVLI
ncbi:MAG: aminoglycoside phosphotransferase family protein, partial [bacterium]|nr:aminoglycoside phosphotransferase family protein [bacterium]